MDYREFIYLLIEKILNSTQENVLLIPHVYSIKGSIENDFNVCKKVFDDFEEIQKIEYMW